jgi:hypothetical protein
LFPLPTVARYTYPFNMRERILAEIKRIAKANGGVAPGKGVFEKETGIRKYDWSGKYWARWSDAVADAGLVAQDYKQKQDTTLFYPKLAEAVRHYGKAPTTAELNLYRKIQPNCPWDNTLRRHFGSINEAYGSLREWAKVNIKYQDIVAMISEIVIPENESIRPTKEGHVYLIKSGAFYKIGRGDELEKRVKQIRTALPDASSLEHSFAQMIHPVSKPIGTAASPTNAPMANGSNLRLRTWRLSGRENINSFPCRLRTLIRPSATFSHSQGLTGEGPNEYRLRPCCAA